MLRRNNETDKFKAIEEARDQIERDMDRDSLYKANNKTLIINEFKKYILFNLKAFNEAKETIESSIKWNKHKHYELLLETKLNEANQIIKNYETILSDLERLERSYEEEEEELSQYGQNELKKRKEDIKEPIFSFATLSRPL